MKIVFKKTGKSITQTNEKAKAKTKQIHKAENNEKASATNKKGVKATFRCFSPFFCCCVLASASFAFLHARIFPQVLLALCSFFSPPVRVVRFYVSPISSSSSASSSSARPQPRPSTPSVPCRTSTASSRPKCSLPDLNHDHPRPVFPAGPQPRAPDTSVPHRTSTATIHAHSVPCRTSTASSRPKCSLPDLNHSTTQPQAQPQTQSQTQPRTRNHKRTTTTTTTTQHKTTNTIANT